MKKIIVFLLCCLLLCGCEAEVKDLVSAQEYNYAYLTIGNEVIQGEVDNYYIGTSFVTVTIDGVKYETGFANVVLEKRE